MKETKTRILCVNSTVIMSHDTNITDTLINVTTTTIGSNSSKYVNCSVIGQTHNEAGLSIQDQVIIGACSIVGILAVFAVILRILMPMFRKTKKKRDKSSSYHHESERKISGSLPPYKLAPSIANSNSSSASSISQYDTSDSSSNQTRSTYCSTDSKLKAFRNLHGSTLSLPVYVPDSRCASCVDFTEQGEELSARTLNDKLLGMLSTRSLEPLQMGDSYRHRWDEEFDPAQLTPTGSLSSLNHPSESRSVSSQRSTIVPITDIRRTISPPSYSASLRDSHLFDVQQRPRYESRLPTKL